MAQFDSLVAEFTHQSASFNATPAMRSQEALHSLVYRLAATTDQHWAEFACGPGLVSRALAKKVRHVSGVDLTPAMIALARSEAEREGVANVSFEVGDAAETSFLSGSLDGAITRLSLHHIPFPERIVAEMARIVRTGGLVVVADHVTSEDPDDCRFHQEIERLRDPSHWLNLTERQLLNIGTTLGLTLVEHRSTPLRLEWLDWLARGSGGAAARPLIESALSKRPSGVKTFRITPADVDCPESVWIELHTVVWRKDV
eukprot:TRINITY_DN18709_c0_g1_i1.p1 TRINITY_DN18709_c0_g1~~TRINITY_DN18709_c0_g1_i1.p1  ORF type:complete len:258 (+),score=34.77 TRINITY_DN18709_c0_g1_i1:174-947(+)